MLGNFIKEITKVAKLSKIYTNHCIYKTMATGMNHSGFSLREIANVTEHKNLNLLKHCVAVPTLAEKHSCNKGPHNYSKLQTPPTTKKRPVKS